jgi:hypothetical protein
MNPICNWVLLYVFITSDFMAVGNIFLFLFVGHQAHKLIYCEKFILNTKLLELIFALIIGSS